MSGMMGMLPGVGKMQKQMENAGFDDSVLRRQIALIETIDIGLVPGFVLLHYCEAT